jgi:hypothetical protein
MRSRQLGIAGVLVSLMAFSGVARASATIDLLWDGATDTLCGVSASSSMTLYVVLTAGPNGSVGGGISVDYSDSIGQADLVGFSSSPPDSIFGLILGNTFDSNSPFTGSSDPWWTSGDSTVHNINGACLSAAGLGSCLDAGQSYLLGTLTFHKTPGAGGFEIVPLIYRTADTNIGTDDILDIDGNVISDTTTFNSAYVIKTGVGKGFSLNDRSGEPRPCRELTDSKRASQLRK